MSTVLVTGAGSGMGNATARLLAAAGHTVYASMRNVNGRNAGRAEAVRELAARDRLALRVVDLDVQSQESADAAVKSVVETEGTLDVVVHNAGHLVIGYAEAFSAEEIEHLLDVNVLGQQRVNRAALPHMRERGAGYLVYIGSTTSPVHPPFMAPYVTSKVAADALAETTAFEVSQLGIETTIVMPGALTEGTEHFSNATRAADQATTAAYAVLDPLVKSVGERTVAMNPEGMDASPEAVGREVVRLLAMEHGTRPHRTLVDFQNLGLEEINDLKAKLTARVLEGIGMERLLTVQTPPARTG